ncbi:MAG: type II toxin-antitoxin system RelE/ParE family toxin [Acidobacteria bacterium]|nr:type II toxin-antitoxin system RelE/ParE family toxin [Acidobacteriota bacterium]
MRVVWSNRALRSLADIQSHISIDSEEAAHRTVDRILKRGDQLAAFPQLGRVVTRYTQAGIRELVEAPYRIVYRVRGEAVEVIDVFHSAQLPPWER